MGSEEKTTRHHHWVTRDKGYLLPYKDYVNSNLAGRSTNTSYHVVMELWEIDTQNRMKVSVATLTLK